MSKIKTVYWKILRYENNAWIVSYWTKPDKSNQIFTKMVMVDELKLRANIEQSTGLKKFNLEQIR